LACHGLAERSDDVLAAGMRLVPVIWSRVRCCTQHVRLAGIGLPRLFKQIRGSGGTKAHAAVTGRMEVIRYLIPHLLAGCIGGVVASVGLVMSNLGSLRDLIMHTHGGWIAFALLTFGMIVTFGSVAVGSAIMSIGSRED
jgi:hypothetical protein